MDFACAHCASRISPYGGECTHCGHYNDLSAGQSAGSLSYNYGTPGPTPSRIGYNDVSAPENTTRRVQAADRRQATPARRTDAQLTTPGKARSRGFPVAPVTHSQAAPSSQRAVPALPVTPTPQIPLEPTTLGLRNMHLQSSHAPVPSQSVAQHRSSSVKATPDGGQAQGDSIRRRREQVPLDVLPSHSAQRVRPTPKTSRLAESLRHEDQIAKPGNVVKKQQLAQSQPSLPSKIDGPSKVKPQPQSLSAVVPRPTVDRPLGNAKPLTIDDMRPPHFWGKDSLMRNEGIPVMPNPPCSARNPEVWPFDFQWLRANEVGRVRTMVWPCTCQVQLANGKRCGKTHPTALHSSAELFLEIWLPKFVKGFDFRCTTCERKQGNGQARKATHSTEDHGKGMWRVLPLCPVNTLDHDLQKFVVCVPDRSMLQGFHPYHYRPDLFDAPADKWGWPSLPADLPRMVVGYYNKYSIRDAGLQDFRMSCDRSRQLLGIKDSIVSGVAHQVTQGPAPTPARIGWSSLVKGHPDLSPPDYRPGHYEWFNASFELDLEKCLNEHESERIRKLKTKWLEHLAAVEYGQPDDKLKSKMKSEVTAAWELYRHIYPHWTPGANWTPPAKLKDWRNGQRALRATKQDEKDKVLVEVVLNFADLDDSIDFEPLDNVDLEFEQWGDLDEDEAELPKLDFSVRRTHPQLAPRSSRDAETHLAAWIRDVEGFLSRNQAYGTWIDAHKVEARSQLAPVFSGHLSKTEADALCSLQDKAFSELVVKVESLVDGLRSKLTAVKEGTGDSTLLTCQNIAEEFRELSRQHEATWRNQLSGYISQGTPRPLVEYYKSFAEKGFEGIEDAYMGLLGGYMPFESRTQTAVPRFRWPKAFLGACTNDTEEVVTTISEVQQEDAPKGIAQEE